MSSSGARAVRGGEEDLSREAVLLQWERKIEAAEAKPGRFDRAAAASTQPEPGAGPLRRFDHASQAAAGGAPALTERRTISITGHPVPVRRRSAVAERQLAQPDRVALWAFLLCLFLVAVAAGTAQAQ